MILPNMTIEGFLPITKEAELLRVSASVVIDPESLIVCRRQSWRSPRSLRAWAASSASATLTPSAAAPSPLRLRYAHPAPQAKYPSPVLTGQSLLPAVRKQLGWPF